MCVCVRVCLGGGQREKERERKRKKEKERKRERIEYLTRLLRPPDFGESKRKKATQVIQWWQARQAFSQVLVMTT